MRNFKILAAAAAVMALASPSVITPAAAAPFTIGVATSGNCYPALCNDSGTSVGQAIDYQQVYGASSFSGPVSITSLTFFFAPQFGGSSLILKGDYLVSLSYAAHGVNALSTNLASNILGSQSLFANAQSKGTDSANPYTTIDGQSAFWYDPANGDLLLEVVASNQDLVPNGSGNGYFESDTRGSVTSRAYCIGNSCSSDATGLVTEFNLESTHQVPEPITLSLFGAGLAGAVGMRRRKQTRA
jgi:hypothetical protein